MTGACSTFCSPESADEKVGAVRSARTLSTHSFALARITTLLCSLLQISTQANQDQHAPVARVPLLVLSVRFSDTPIHASGRPHHMCIPLLYCSVASARKVRYSSK